MEQELHVYKNGMKNIVNILYEQVDYKQNHFNHFFYRGLACVLLIIVLLNLIKSFVERNGDVFHVEFRGIMYGKKIY